MQAEETRLQAWKVALKKGDDELDAGDSVPYNAATLEGITRSAKAAPAVRRTLMSSRSLPIRLSRKARQDFIDILRYTGETWGPDPA